MAEISIEVMDPAEVTLPLHIEEISFMNRSIYPELIYSDTVRWTRKELHVLDTIMRNWIFHGVREVMDGSPLYDMERISIVQARRSDTSGIIDPLTQKQLDQLKSRYSADAVISLEYYYVKDSVSVWLMFDQINYEAYMAFFPLTIWRIYDLQNDTIVDEYLMRERTEWIATGESTEQALDQLPRAVDALREAAFVSGIRFGERVSPTWKATSRFFFSGGNSYLRKATKHLSEGKWDEAAEIWQLLAEDEYRATAAMACFNLALYREMEDDIIGALDWAVKSYEYKQKELTREYIELLKLRYYERRQLKKQLPVELG